MMRIAPQKECVRGAVTVSLLVILIFLGKALLDRRQHMQTDATSAPDRNLIEATVTIQRPVNEVFRFYRDFKNLPSFLGDVMAIEPTGPATSRWTIEGPFGIRAHWTIEVTEVRENELIRYETVTSPTTRTYWEIYFAPGPEPGETQVREVMKAPGGRLVRDALALIGKYPAQEVSANLHRFKQVMETGGVTDTTYAVPGKFPQP
jgi:uncharacterized membrane protein